MLLNHLRKVGTSLKLGPNMSKLKYHGVSSTKPLSEHGSASNTPKEDLSTLKEDSTIIMNKDVDISISKELYPTRPTVPMALMKRDEVVLPFDKVPGPVSLRLLAKVRYYLSAIGTQLTAGVLTLGYDLVTGNYFTQKQRVLSALFDEYGPVVRFVSPVGGDIVLLSNPEHIEQVFSAEGEAPVRSILDSLERYRTERKNSIYGLYNTKGEVWRMQRTLVGEPLNVSMAKHLEGFEDICNNLVVKIYNCRNYHDELDRNLYTELHKWAFDCMGLLIFSKKFSMLQTDVIYNQCDMSWLYYSLSECSSALLKCESGMQLWKIIPTLSWQKLVKHCDNVDNLIGKYVIEVDQKLGSQNYDSYAYDDSLITTLLTCKEKLSTEDISTILMDMLLIGINTITTSMTFLLYNIAKHQRVQRLLIEEIDQIPVDTRIHALKHDDMPYLQVCIKENLRLVPPIPLLTRILQKNVLLDKYNIPRGTLIIMSTIEAALKESNFDDAQRFYPERWLNNTTKEHHHTFASIPFGFGARKCLGQNIAETMIFMMTIKILQKYRLEYHYGDIYPTNTFIIKPNKSPKIRFIDRL